MTRFVAQVILLLLLLQVDCMGQDAVAETAPPQIRLRGEIINGDTVPVVDLNTVNVYTQFEFSTKKQKEQWTRTKYNVKKVYPYAIVASAKLKEYDLALSRMQDEHLRKAFIKVCEKDLREQFEDDLKNLTVSQGKVLMKLIVRETGKTTYEIVKEMRGGFQAAMWQSLASLFGNSMKVEYNPENEDLMIERAVKLVESGQF
jgi:Domain of unknown function (DUF4294)